MRPTVSPRLSFGTIGALLASLAMLVGASALPAQTRAVAGALPSVSPELEQVRAALDKYRDPVVAVHDGYEAVDSVWIAPPAALERAKDGTYQLRFPTQMNVQKLGRHTSSTQAMDAARASRVVTVMTKHERTGDGKRYVRIPLEADYGGDVFEVIDSESAGG